MDKEENSPDKIKQHLEEDEVIESMTIPLDEFESTVRSCEWRLL